MSEYQVKRGHPILAIVLGILGVIFALLLATLTGVVGGALSFILGLIALLLGIFGLKAGGRGWGGVITGALAIILAVLMAITSVMAFTEIRKEAEKYAAEAPLVVKSLSSPYLGLVGMILNIPQDEGTAQQLIDQYNLVNKKIEKAKKAQ